MRSPPLTGSSCESGTPLLFHDAHRLVRADDGSPGSLRDAFGSPEVVEMGVADHDPVGPLNVICSQAGADSPRDAIDIRIQEQHQRSDREPEGGATVPVKPCCHRLSPPFLRTGEAGQLLGKLPELAAGLPVVGLALGSRLAQTIEVASGDLVQLRRRDQMRGGLHSLLNGADTAAAFRPAPFSSAYRSPDASSWP